MPREVVGAREELVSKRREMSVVPGVYRRKRRLVPESLSRKETARDGRVEGVGDGGWFSPLFLVCEGACSAISMVLRWKGTGWLKGGLRL